MIAPPLLQLALALVPPGSPQVSDVRGEELLTELRCVACHAPPEGSHLQQRFPLFDGPRLDALGKRVRAGWIQEHLADPGPRMPDLLGGLAADEREAAAQDLGAFLSSLGGPFTTRAPLVNPRLLEEGRQLYHRLGCVACHAPLEVPEDLELPLWSFEGGLVEGAGFDEELLERSLEHLARKTGHEALAEFLLDPLAVRPAGEMPSLNLTPAEARTLAVYLTTPEVRPDGPGFNVEPGLVAEYYEANPPDRFEGLPTRIEVVSTLELPPHRPDHFAFRFSGFVNVPEAGSWRFTTESDDGSRLYVDGRLVVDNWGDHGPRERAGEVTLTPGRHAIEVEMYERGGGEHLAVTWAGPGLPRGALPAAALVRWSRTEEAQPEHEPAPPADRVRAGAERFSALRCDACHGQPGGVETSTPAKPLTALDPAAEGGCLDAQPAPGVPRFALEPADRIALVRTLGRLGDLDRPQAPADALHATLNRLNCTACHQRGGHGGPSLARDAYFEVKGDLDLGNEGRLPPRLDHVGWKLLPHALDAVLQRGEGVRPYMHTRMPVFGEDNVGHLAELLTAVDLADRAPAEPAYREEDIELGQRLAGTSGLGCIQCHNLGGHESIGIPAVDLALVHDRVRVDWFRELLLDPESLGMNSRMPRFFGEDGTSPVRDILGGDPARQAEALWTWLSLGSAMPLPEGLVVDAGAYELVPTDRVITTGVFFGGASARVTLVGFPERVHAAFDVENSRLISAWKGRFFNAEGTWHGRAGQLERAMGEDVIEFPDGVPFARLETPGDPWPTRSADEEGYRVQGRHVAPDGRPTFRYVAGDVEVEEELAPALRPGGAALVRRLRVRSDQGGQVVLRAAVSARFEALPEGLFQADDGRVYALRAPAGADFAVVDGPDGQELRITLPLGADPATLEVETRW